MKLMVPMVSVRIYLGFNVFENRARISLLAFAMTSILLKIRMSFGESRKYVSFDDKFVMV